MGKSHFIVETILSDKPVIFHEREFPKAPLGPFSGEFDCRVIIQQHNPSIVNSAA